MVRVQRSPRAKRDLIDIWLYIAEDSPAAADRLLDRLEAAFRLLADYPEIGSDRSDLRSGLRLYVVGDYLILYRLHAETVQVARVVHGRRNLSALV